MSDADQRPDESDPDLDLDLDETTPEPAAAEATPVEQVQPQEPAEVPKRSLLTMWLMQVGLWAMALVIVAVPMGLTALISESLAQTPAQPPLPDAAISAQDRLAWRAQGAQLPANAPPVVLSYRDVRPGAGDRHAVSPEAFERQLVALAEAGYRTVGSQEYVDYLNGAPAGPRSVYVTIDDGTAGLYRFADRVLQRQHMRAAAYLVSSRVGTHKPYYLTWKQVRQMRDSGRWDFEAHTHDLHTRGPVGTDRVNGSLLTGRAWDPKTDQPETRDQHRARVSVDLSAQLSDFALHGLPRPQLFSYPFSDLGSHTDSEALQDTRTMIGDMFVGAFTNRPDGPSSTSRRAAAAGEIRRIEVNGDTTPAALVAEVGSWTAIPPDRRDPLQDPGRWWDERAGGVPKIDVFLHNAPSAQERYVRAAYAPFASADWTDYQVDADIQGLKTGVNNANLAVRVGSAAELTIRVSHDGVQVVDPATKAIKARQALTPADRHHVQIKVAAGATLVQVDKGSAMRIATNGGPADTGGLAIAARSDARQALPTFTALTVSTLDPAAE